MNAFETEEIDVAFYNDQEPHGLRGFNQILLLIECKNWSKTVGSMEVSWFLTKIRNRGLDFGILVAANGVTGDAHDKTAAHNVVSMALAANVRLIIITRAEIENLNSSEDLVMLIKEKVCQLVVTGTVWP